MPPIPTPSMSLPWYLDSDILALAQTAFGLLSLGLATIAVVYAWRVAKRQFGMMDKQTAMMGEQTEISKRQEAIALKQGEIVETQHKIMLEQISKRTDLRVRSGLQNTHWGTDGYKPLTITLSVINGGNKSADGFHWEVFIPQELAFKVKFVDEAGNEIPGLFAPFSESEVYAKLDGHYPHKLFPWSSVEVAKIAVQNDMPATQEFTIKWRIRGEDGSVPSHGLGEIRYRRVNDGTYGVMHPAPEGIQNPKQSEEPHVDK